MPIFRLDLDMRKKRQDWLIGGEIIRVFAAAPHFGFWPMPMVLAYHCGSDDSKGRLGEMRVVAEFQIQPLPKCARG
jgi:hypothetical protein